MRRLAAPSALLAGLLIGTLPLASEPAIASTQPLVQRLISKSQAAKLGFSKVVKAATQGSDTGDKKCATGAEVVFMEPGHVKGLIDEVFSCKSSSDAKALAKMYQSSFKPTASFPPPKALGVGAVGSNATNDFYVYYWTHGSLVAFIALDVDATTNKKQYELNTEDKATPSQLAALTKAALDQNLRLS